MKKRTEPRTRRGGTCAAATLAGVALLALAACNAGQAGKPDVGRADEAAALQAKAQQTAVERGKYLTTIGGCNDCHTPMKMGPNGPEPDTARLLSGHPQGLEMPEVPRLSEPWMMAAGATMTVFAGPWGTSYAINLTPDNDTGIGLWSEQVFVNALKTGRHMGVGRPILPPMPWPNTAQMTDEDLKAIYAYLRSIEPKKNQVPDAVILEPPPAPPTGAPPAQ
jgi:mono/diheme cytochrome c family protein